MNLQHLNDAQLQAVTAPMGPILVLAGAGSGKTRVLTNRILYLVQDCGVHPSEILAITFTNKAANEMKRRLYEFDCDAQFMHVSTIHSFCASVLRSEYKALQFGSNFSIYDESEKRTVLKQVAKSVFSDVPAQMLDSFADSISDIKNNAPELLDGDIAQLACSDEYLMEQMDRLSQAASCSDNAEIIDVINGYRTRMLQNNAMDFDDLLYYVHKLFGNEQILQKYRQRFRYILIDEFQDTNKVQYDIFKMLAGQDGNIFVVGDDDQSIYGWRGADAYNLKKFERDFSNCHIYKLEQNYRSTKRILEAANALIAPNDNRFDKVLWTDNPEGVKVQLYTAYNELDEAYYVVEQLKNLRYMQPNGRFRDFAILMRVNALSRSFEQQLQQNGIPFKVFGGFKFFERREVKDALAYMKLVHNPYDAEAFVRALNVPRRRGIGDSTVAKLRDLSVEYGIPMTDVISDERNLEGFNSAMRTKLTDFHKLTAKLGELSVTQNVSVFVHTMLEMLDFRKALIEADEEDRALNIDELEESVAEFLQADPQGTLADYLQTVGLAQDADEMNDADYVTLATIHAVKGLEFRTVFVVGMEEGLFPISRATYEAEGMQEERRLIYVAATRAEERLYFTRAQTRFMWGQRKKNLASRYFNEVQKLYVPKRPPLNEAQLHDDRLLDRLNNAEYRRPMPSAPTANETDFRAGQKVEHSSFGKGMILRINGPIADVVFEGVGKKTLNVKFAPLKVIK